jgi:hypothetical protein
MFLAMVSMTLWLLIKGIHRAQWDAMQSSARTAVDPAGRESISHGRVIE